MPFEVRIRREVIKEAKRLPKSHREKLARFLKILSENPVPVPDFDIKPIKGRKGRYRLRLGNYRVFYNVYWDDKILLVLKIVPRERAYSRR